MRALFWCESFWPAIGGSELFATVLLGELRRRGHEFEVVTRLGAEGDVDRIEYDGMPVHRIAVDERAASERDMSVILPARQRIARVKKRFRPDLVHVSLPGPSLFVHRFTRQSAWECPTLVSLHVPLEPTLVVFRRPSYDTIREADWVTACSRALLDHARWMVPEIRGRCSVIYNGLPAPLPVSRDARPREPGFHLACAGRLVPQKGFDTALRALARLRAQGEDVRLVIAGDGPERAALERLADDLGVAHWVHFPGWLESAVVQELFAGSDAVLMPSEWEPFGLVALQAAQLGRPVVASSVDGVPEVVVDGETGLLAEPGDATGFADRVARLIAEPGLASALGAAARRRCHARFSAGAMADAFEQLYQRLATAAPPGTRGLPQ